MPKTRTAAQLRSNAATRLQTLMDVYKYSGKKAFLIEGHGHYPIYKKQSPAKSYILRRGTPVQVPPGKAVIYLSEPGKCMFISTGRMLGAGYFMTSHGLENYLSGKAEAEGVHHANVSRKAFVPGDSFIDSAVSLAPKANQPSFGYVWHLPIRHPRFQGVNMSKNRVPTVGEVLNLPRKDMWVSDIVRDGPYGVYIVSSCLDVPHVPTAYNFPNAPKGFFAPSTKTKAKYAIRGAGIRKKLLSAFRPGIFKKKSLPKKTVVIATKEYRGNLPTANSHKLAFSPYPQNKNVNWGKIVSITNKANARAKRWWKVTARQTKPAEVLRKLQKNSTINLKTIQNLPADRTVLKDLRATQRALQTMRRSPSVFRHLVPARLALKTKIPGFAASSIYSAIRRDPKIASAFSRSPNTPQGSPLN